MSLDQLTTEGRNPASEAIDSLSALQIVHLMNVEDARVADAVRADAESIARAIDVIADRLARGGRLIYLGAGTSGRLGVLDASECPPTFNTPPGLVVGLIAGGPTALTRAVEGAEDYPDNAIEDLKAIDLSKDDVLVGIATSGRTPYVIAGLEYGKTLGAFTIGLSCNQDSQVARVSQLTITPIVGPEVISGSTRLKAGTATKMILNILTTGAMVRLGKTYGNLMVDLQTTSQKLADRSRRIVMALTDLTEPEAEAKLQNCGGDVKTAVVAHLRSISADEARRLLAEMNGHLRKALEQPTSESKAKFTSDRPADQPTVSADELVLGIDGGGSKTTAWLALTESSRGEPLGRGTSGPSNPQSVGWDVATRNLDRAVIAAFADAGREPAIVASACVALAGGDREYERGRLTEWAEQRRLARRFHATHDAAPLLAAGTPDGTGIAVIAGTGSLAFGRNSAGQTARAGGWGHLFGDEGSGYAMALAGLTAVAKSLDGRGESTQLRDGILQELNITDPSDLISTVYPHRDDRTWLASLAKPVLAAAAAGDAVARRIVTQAAEDLAAMVEALARTLDLAAGDFPLALGGGILIHFDLVQQLLLKSLVDHGLNPAPVKTVAEPVAGAVLLATLQESCN